MKYIFSGLRLWWTLMVFLALFVAIYSAIASDYRVAVWAFLVSFTALNGLRLECRYDQAQQDIALLLKQLKDKDGDGHA